MAIDIKVPTLGESVTEATVAKWFKAAGDAVAVNAGAALYVAGLAVDVPTGVEQATEILAQGLALETLEGLRRS